MAREIIVSEDEYEVRIALLEEGRCVELFYERRDTDHILGNIYKGRVNSVLPGMQAAFVDIGTDKNAFLHVSDLQTHVNEFGEVERASEGGGRGSRNRTPIEQILKKGQEILVQIDKEPIGSKGPRVTAYVTIPGRYLVYLPTSANVGISRRIEDEKERARLKELLSKHMPPSGGVIVRTASGSRGEDEFVPEVKFLVKTWEDVLAKSERVRAPALVYEDLGLAFRMIRDVFTDDVDRFVIDSKTLHEQVAQYIEGSLPTLRDKVVFHEGPDTAFEDFGIEQEIKKAIARRIWLKSGGHIVIDQTEALVAIDVNTGKFVGTEDHEETIYKNNLEAAVEIARQIRLRDLGGIIVLDFIDMENPTNRRHVLRTLEQEIRKDRARTNILQFTELGIIEMTRQRTKESLHSMFCTACPYCGGTGSVLSEETLIIQLLRALKRVARRVPRKAYRLVVSDMIAKRLHHEDRDKLRVVTRDLKVRVDIDTDADMHMEDFRIFELPRNRELFVS
ncbi:Rne/Rng family ribonuclease [Candidatus Poribacteria bacterium]|nr:Rne/Rng family ribonuclease [Candidatus Poribacteria bacterium]